MQRGFKRNPTENIQYKSCINLWKKYYSFEGGLLFWSVSLIELKIKSLLLKIWKFELKIDYVERI